MSSETCVSLFPSEEFNLGTFRDFLPDLLASSCRDNEVLISFQDVIFWDPAALMWFALCLKQLMQNGKAVRIRLPDPDPIAPLSSIPISRVKRIQKSADFLRRWRFDLVLRRLGGVESILVADQRDYFSSEKQKKYTARTVHDSHGQTYEMSSTTLFPFFDFATLEQSGAGVSEREVDDDKPDVYQLRISRSTVNGKIKDLSEAAIAGVLAKNCAITVENSKIFVKKIIGEALDNMEKHPDASFGMMAINRSPRNGKLYLAVVDNGESICETILSTFNQDTAKNYKYDDLCNNALMAAEVLDYSTLPEVSSKPDGSGMGLYYMKRHALNTFGGTLQILTSGVLCSYSSREHEEFPHYEKWEHGWKGNLLRVEIPIEGGHE